MSLQAGHRIGSIEILGSLGAGGMGEVYRGRDTKLGREVAVKILPASVSTDPDRLARFEREARTLALLNHPNIAQVYGFEDGALVMELLEGETLRDRLRGGALSTRKAIEYATQIARGLAAAHDRGVIHRDLKPENIFLLRDGQVKLLDFGLARPIDGAATGKTETVTAQGGGTDPGTVLGTVGYMSPEQVRAEPIDARTDLFSLGAVLYEMLSGERAFKRNTNAETMTAILREEPVELSGSRADISPAVDRIVRHALEKNPVERFQTARDIAFALDALSGSASAASARVAARSPINRERLVWVAVTIVLAAAAVWMGLSGRNAGSTESASYQVTLALPDEVRTAPAIAQVYRLAVSPDGTTVAFAGLDQAGQRRLWISSLRTGSVKALDEPGNQPAFSPDGQQIVFSQRVPGGSVSKRVNLAGGPAETIGSFSGIKAWSKQGTLLLSQINQDIRAIDLSSSVTKPRVVTPAGPATYVASSFLPDGRHFLATVFSTDLEAEAVVVASLDSPEVTRLVEGASTAFYAKGAVAFTKGTTLFAQRLDERRMTLIGQPRMITDGIEQSATGGLAIASSESGTLVLQRPEQRGRSQLRWFRRDGSIAATVGEPGDYSNIELSPDGKRLLVSITDPRITTRDLFILDLQRGIRQRLTVDPVDERSGVWTADGQRVIYRSKNQDLYVRPADFTGSETLLITGGGSKDPYGVSADGSLLAYRASGVNQSNDVMLFALDGKSAPVPLQATPFDEVGGSFSPDGKSAVYQSDESGQSEIYVKAVGGAGGRVLLSNNGGTSPRWLRNGKEIFYLSADRALMSVAVSGSGATFTAGTPQRLFQLETPGGGGSQFDVGADGRQIVAVNANDAATRVQLTAIINWPALIKD